MATVGRPQARAGPHGTPVAHGIGPGLGVCAWAAGDAGEETASCMGVDVVIGVGASVEGGCIVGIGNEPQAGAS